MTNNEYLEKRYVISQEEADSIVHIARNRPEMEALAMLIMSGFRLDAVMAAAKALHEAQATPDYKGFA